MTRYDHIRPRPTFCREYCATLSRAVVRDEKYGQRLAAFIVPQAGVDVDEESIESF
jgi:hypothetical protein